MDILQELSKIEIRNKAIEELIESQNKIINDCIDRYKFYKVELEKIDILTKLSNENIENIEQRNRYAQEVESALNEAKQAIELKAKLESLK
ncbi:hypothetical protein [Clostridium sp. DJ247]|uniref:hypothetical protein n=1 Tax=Clostridium sp. DJ247 TaxID=2726188 RepID=UPI001626CECE|nr:hypothetical protein [Clostridium sp. DJ247]MBC2581031.1 hypothetical protein [Clostridium sp. DJ247]